MSTRAVAVPSDSTSDRLLLAAAQLFRERGYAASTTRELAQRLGIQKASLYYHFAKKEDLLYRICVEALTRVQKQVAAAISGETDPARRLAALISAHVECMLLDIDMNATLLLERESLSGARRARVLKLRDAYEDLVVEEVGRAQAAAILRRDIEVKYLVLALMNLLNWTVVWYRPGGPMSPEALGRLFVKMYIDGAGAAPARKGSGAAPHGRARAGTALKD